MSAPSGADLTRLVGHHEKPRRSVKHRSEQVTVAGERPPAPAVRTEPEQEVPRSGPDEHTAAEDQRRRREIGAVTASAVKAPAISARTDVDRV